eukprot:scaffold2619_cov129-Cylindrotheca_fusiformis.AAC.14
MYSINSGYVVAIAIDFKSLSSLPVTFALDGKCNMREAGNIGLQFFHEDSNRHKSSVWVRTKLKSDKLAQACLIPSPFSPIAWESLEERKISNIWTIGGMAVPVAFQRTIPVCPKSSKSTLILGSAVPVATGLARGPATKMRPQHYRTSPAGHRVDPKRILRKIVPHTFAMNSRCRCNRSRRSGRWWRGNLSIQSWGVFFLLIIITVIFWDIKHRIRMAIPGSTRL